MLKKTRLIVLAVFTVVLMTGVQQGVFAEVVGTTPSCVPTYQGPGIGYVTCTDSGTDCGQVDDPFCTSLCSTFPGFNVGWATSCNPGAGFECACAA